MPLLFHNTEVHPLFVASPCQRLDIYFLGRPSFLLGEYNLVFFITYPLRHKTYTKPLYFHKVKETFHIPKEPNKKISPDPQAHCQNVNPSLTRFRYSCPKPDMYRNMRFSHSKEISDWRPFGLKADIRTMEKAQPAQAKKECVSHRLIYVTI